jgi:queuosine precursor transporter
MNELLWVITLLVNFFGILLFYKLFKKPGLFIWIGIATILCNIQVLKTVEIFGIVATLGNIIYGSIFLATDILSEKYGKEEARKGVLVGFFSLLTMIILMNIAIYYIPHESDFSQESLKTIFEIMPRIGFASLIAYLISQFLDTGLYAYLKRKTDKIWIRNNLSTIISQLVDSVIFSTIAFLGVFELSIFMQILLSTYLFKFAVSILDTPFIYLAKKINH